MELAGLSVAQAVHKAHPIQLPRKVLVLAGPGNNGGDGLVAARHLHFFGYQIIGVYYPKQKQTPLFTGLETQLRRLHVPLLAEPAELKAAFAECSHVVDALFGFSFKGTVRAPFDQAIELLRARDRTKTYVTSVDIPSGWDVDEGPVPANGPTFTPDSLVSLTAPKRAAHRFLELGTPGEIRRHFVGGRFVDEDLAKKYDFEVPDYEGVDQVVEVSSKL
ncbi:hypothetical protein DV452_001835 [Geotrichum candidum]|nr:hypothetical protein DV452_001835 [Geotrichum candidum]